MYHANCEVEKQTFDVAKDYGFCVCQGLGTDSSEGLFNAQVSSVFSAVVGSDEVKEFLHSSHLLPLHRGRVRRNLDSVSTLTSVCVTFNGHTPYSTVYIGSTISALCIN